MDKKEFNYRKLNDLITLSNKILKILFILIIILGLYAIIMLIKEVKIVSFILSILKIIAPLFIGIVIAWLLDPIVDKLNKKGIKRGLGSLICYVVLIGGVVIVVSALVPVLSNQINDFVTTTLPNVFDSAKNWIDNIFDKLDNIQAIDAVAMKAEVFGKLEEFAKNLTTSLPEILVNSIKSLFSGLGVVGIGLIIGFYLLLDFDKNAENLYSLLPRKYRIITKEVLDMINKPLRAFVNGALIDCSIIFVITALGFSLIGLKSALLFALFCAITNIIPYVGPYIGGAPAVVVAFSQSTPVGIAVLIFIFVTQMIEGYFLQPFIMSKKIKLSPVTIIVGLLIFGHFFGIVGMVISTPLVGVLKETINFLDEKYDIFNFSE